MRNFLMYTIIASIGLASVGCSYGSVTSHGGKLYVVRNDGFLGGALRKIYECTPTDEGKMDCVVVTGAP